jgi:hypothetical protein
MRYSRYLLLVLLLTACVLSLPGTAAAQCAMCRAALAGSANGHFMRNLNLGILILLVPPVTIFCSIFVVLRRRGTNSDSTEQDGAGH